MKKFYFLLAGATLCLTANAQKVMQTQNYGKMQADTIYHVSVGPGTTETYTKVSFNTNAAEGYNATTLVNIVEVDLTNPYVTLRVNRAGNTNQTAVTKNVKAMMAENTKYGHHYMVGINGDFFGGANTSGYCVSRGSFMHSPDNMSNGVGTNQLVIGHDGTPTIASAIEFGGTGDNLGTVIYPSGVEDNTLRKQGVRWGNYLNVYNEYYKGSGTSGETSDYGQTCTNQWGSEAVLLPVQENCIYGHFGEYIVDKVLIGVGNTVVPHGGLVLSANGEPKANVDALNEGNKVKLKLPFKADGKEISCRETVGGYPRLVTDGQAISGAPSGAPGDIALTSRRSRTAVGYNADKTKMYLFVVSEQSTKNQGLTAKALANLMQAWGCHEALNLDGGGSSTLYVENLGLRNDVQGGWSYMRPVVNGLFVENNAPVETAEVARIEFVDKALTIQPGRGYQPVIYAYNEYGTLISTGLQNYTLSAPEATFDASKRKMITPASGYFALTAEYNGITTSIPVKVSAEGISGSDPATAPTFKGDEFVEILRDPNAPIAPEDQIFAELEDITPAGYDFDKYEAGTRWEFDPLPETAPAGTWTAPFGTYNQDKMDTKGIVSSLHISGIDLDQQETYTNNTKAGSQPLLPDTRQAFSIQKHPVERVGNVLVYTQNYSPGHHRMDWPNVTINTKPANSFQLSFYPDAKSINGLDEKHPVRFRMVVQFLYRGRHDQPAKDDAIKSVYFSTGKASIWGGSYNGAPDTEVGKLFPLNAAMNYRWLDEGTTIAEIPAEKYLLDGGGQDEPWDVNQTTKEPIDQSQYATHYLINDERFVVYEFDMSGKPADGQLGVHINFGFCDYTTIVFKEIKFFNVLNGEELLTQMRKDDLTPKAGAPAKAQARAENSTIKTTTAYGSLLGTRHISYRYYTEDGVKEIEAEGTTTGVDDVAIDVDNNDNAPVEYYNLQGVKVLNPTGGIYIKRQGTKTSKVLIK